MYLRGGQLLLYVSGTFTDNNGFFITLSSVDITCIVAIRSVYDCCVADEIIKTHCHCNSLYFTSR